MNTNVSNREKARIISGAFALLKPSIIMLFTILFLMNSFPLEKKENSPYSFAEAIVTGIVITDIATVTESCFGGLDGSLTVTALCHTCINGSADIHYSLNGGLSQLSNTFSNLGAGTFSVRVEDVNDPTCFYEDVISIDSPTGSGLSYFELEKLTASDAASFDSFGREVAISGNRIIVGANGDDDNGFNSGSAYIYEWDGTSWNETKLLASDGLPNDIFGLSVAISNDRVVVGAPFSDPNGILSGSAYIFEWDGSSWVETKIVASDATGDTVYGHSVAISGNRVIVGAYEDDSNGANSGSAYIYEWNGTSWVETKLVPSDGDPEDFFGIEVSISGDRAVVGSSFDDASGENSGSIYIYDWNGTSWIPTKLTPSDSSPFYYFGTDVGVYYDRIVVGSSFNSSSPISTGTVYVYDWDGTSWLETKITPSSGPTDDLYGRAVSISANRLVVAADEDDTNGVNFGAAYIYDWDGINWNESKILASDGASEDNYGEHVAVSGNLVVIGSRRDDDNGSSSGSAYIMDFTVSTLENEILVEGGVVPAEITDGDLTPNLIDGTDFGLADLLTNTDNNFLITNLGASDLVLTGNPNPVEISGDPSFTILSQPANNILVPNSSESFVVRYTPIAYGIHTATITIMNDDCSEPVYTFSITGNASNCPSEFTLSGTQLVSEDYETNGFIASDQLIDASIQVDYDAGIFIELQIGFEVEVGAVFDAFINGCNGGIGGNQISSENNNK